MVMQLKVIGTKALLLLFEFMPLFLSTNMIRGLVAWKGEDLQEELDTII